MSSECEGVCVKRKRAELCEGVEAWAPCKGMWDAGVVVWYVGCASKLEVSGGERGRGQCNVVCLVGEYSIFWGGLVEWGGG